MENLATTIFTSAVVASISGVAVNAWLENRKLKNATQLDGLTAAVALEGFAITCADKISDHDLAVSSGGHAGSFLGSVPELPQISVLVGFLRPKKATVANELLIFPQEIEQADQAISFWWEVTADVGAARNEAVGLVAKIGLRASDLALDIRGAFKLPKRDLIFGEYNVRESLTRNIREFGNG